MLVYRICRCIFSDGQKRVNELQVWQLSIVKFIMERKSYTPRKFTCHQQKGTISKGRFHQQVPPALFQEIGTSFLRMGWDSHPRSPWVSLKGPALWRQLRWLEEQFTKELKIWGFWSLGIFAGFDWLGHQIGFGNFGFGKIWTFAEMSLQAWFARIFRMIPNSLRLDVVWIWKKTIPNFALFGMWFGFEKKRFRTLLFFGS